VIGAGAAGLTIAHELAGAGLAVIVVAGAGASAGTRPGALSRHRDRSGAA